MKKTSIDLKYENKYLYNIWLGFLEFSVTEPNELKWKKTSNIKEKYLHNPQSDLPQILN